MVLYVLLVLFWGSTFLWVAIATKETSPFTVSAVRLAVGAAVVVAVIALLGADIRRAHAPAALGPWLRRGIVLALLAAVIPSVLLAFAQREISSGTASIVNATAPLWTALVAWVAIRGPGGRVGAVQVAGLVIGLLGVAVLVGEAPTSAEIEGQLLVVLVALVYGSGGVYAQRVFAGAPPLTAAITSTAIGAAIAAPFGVAGWIADPPTAGALGALVVLGATSSGLAYVIYFELIRRLGATRTLTVTYLQPAVAIALGVLVLGEELRLAHLAGLSLILLGIAIVHGQLSRARRPRSARRRPPAMHP